MLRVWYLGKMTDGGVQILKISDDPRITGKLTSPDARREWNCILSTLVPLKDFHALQSAIKNAQKVSPVKEVEGKFCFFLYDGASVVIRGAIWESARRVVFDCVCEKSNDCESASCCTEQAHTNSLVTELVELVPPTKDDQILRKRTPDHRIERATITRNLSINSGRWYR